MTSEVVLYGEDEAKAALVTMRGHLDEGISAFERASQVCAGFDAGEGWRVLGYRSLAACLAFELQVTRGRAYDLITKMRASVLIADEKEPSRERSRKELGQASAKKTVAGATESDQLDEELGAPSSEPITRQAFDGGRSGADFDAEDGEAVYRCRHCQRVGTIASLGQHCLDQVRAEVEAF